MSTLVRSACAALFLFAVQPAPMANAADSNPGYADVEFCNKTSGVVFLALSYGSAPGSGEWIVEGWKKIEAGGCFTATVPNDGKIYDYAEDDADGVWAGDFKLCVEHPGPFKRINSPDFACEDSELVGFSVTDLTGRSHDVINYNP
jgi:uncharacterized membrane protein